MWRADLVMKRLHPMKVKRMEEVPTRIDFVVMSCLGWTFIVTCILIRNLSLFLDIICGWTRRGSSNSRVMVESSTPHGISYLIKIRMMPPGDSCKKLNNIIRLLTTCSRRDSCDPGPKTYPHMLSITFDGCVNYIPKE